MCPPTTYSPPSTPGHYKVLSSAAAGLLHEAFNRDKRLYVLAKSIGHEAEVPVRGDERDGPVIIKSRQADTLVELNVFQLDSFLLPSTTLILKEYFVVQP